MALFYNKPVVIDDLVFYVDAGNKRSFNEDDLAYDGAAVNAQTAFVSAGTSSFVVPVGVTSISAVAVGGGGGGNANMFQDYPGAGGGGGGLAYGTFTVTPGETLTIVVGAAGTGGDKTGGETARTGKTGGDSQVKRGDTILLQGEGGEGTQDSGAYETSIGGSGGTSSGTQRDGGGAGGAGGSPQFYTETQQSGGGGGAGGYSGNGGNGGSHNTGVYQSTAGSGGAGGGGGSDTIGTGQNGGGVGILGEGSSGAAGSQNSGGGAGSGGSGFTYGGGGGGGKGSSSGFGSWTGANGNDGSVGAVRLVYQPPNLGNRYYPDGSGTVSNIADATYNSPTNTWKDLTTNVNNATLNFSNFDSNFGGSLLFGRDGSRRGELSSDMFNPELDFTFSAWVRMPDTIVSTTWYAIAGDYSGGSNSFDLRYRVSTGGIRLGGNGWTRDFDNSDILVASTWYNITVTRSSDTYTLYYNGSSIDTETHPAALDYDGGPRSIGTWTSTVEEWFDGNISTVMAYSRALTAAEVLQNYNALLDRYA